MFLWYEIIVSLKYIASVRNIQFLLPVSLVLSWSPKMTRGEGEVYITGLVTHTYILIWGQNQFSSLFSNIPDIRTGHLSGYLVNTGMVWGRRMDWLWWRKCKGKCQTENIIYSPHGGYNVFAHLTACTRSVWALHLPQETINPVKSLFSQV